MIIDDGNARRAAKKQRRFERRLTKLLRAPGVAGGRLAKLPNQAADQGIILSKPLPCCFLSSFPDRVRHSSRAEPRGRPPVPNGVRAFLENLKIGQVCKASERTEMASYLFNDAKEGTSVYNLRSFRSSKWQFWFIKKELAAEENMSKRDRLLSLSICVVFGFLGGVVSNVTFSNVKTAEAQQVAKVIKAERFEVIDEKGVTRAHLGGNIENGSELVLSSNAGEVHLYSTGAGSASLNLHSILGDTSLTYSGLTVAAGDFRYIKNRRIEAVVNGKGQGRITISNDKGNPTWEAK